MLLFASVNISCQMVSSIGDRIFKYLNLRGRKFPVVPPAKIQLHSFIQISTYLNNYRKDCPRRTKLVSVLAQKTIDKVRSTGNV